MTSRTFKTLAILAVNSLIAACGGGGGGGGSAVPEPPAPDVSPAGIWNGTTSNDAELGLLVLDDGLYYAVYSTSGNSSVIAGLIRGGGTTSGSQFTSDSSSDFNFEGAGVTPVKMDATVVFQTTLNGTVAADADPSERVTFTSKFNPLYNQTPSLADIAGTYDGQLNTEAGAAGVRLEISREGEVFVTGPGTCVSIGKIEPHLSGNSYNVTFYFGNAPPIGGCTFRPRQGFTGAGVFQEKPPAFYDRKFVIALVNMDGTSAAVFSSR